MLVPPIVQLAEPGQTRCYGDCCNYSGLAGIRSRIRLRPSILDGTLRNLKHGSRNPEGLRRFLEDVLLHEMIHQYHQEVTGEQYVSYGGHGPAFSAKANEIGEGLGLPRVRRTCKSRDGEEPSPSQWPHDVRPADYYLVLLR
jgi:SprT-like family